MAAASVLASAAPSWPDPLGNLMPGLFTTPYRGGLPEAGRPEAPFASSAMAVDTAAGYPSFRSADTMVLIERYDNAPVS